MTRSSAPTSEEKTRYLHVDHLGSVETVTDQSGSKSAEKRSYDAFGARRNPQWGAAPVAFSSLTTRGFTGHEDDEELGLINMKGRLYDPKVGRFLTADPLVSHPAFGQSWNPYSYVFNNPLAFTDPSGFETTDTTYSNGTRDVVFDSDPLVAHAPRGPPPATPPPPPPNVDASLAGLTTVPVDLNATGNKAASVPQRPADGASALDASGGSPVTGDKWGPYSPEARIRKALLGSEPPLEDPLAPYGPELAHAAIGFVPGLNSYMVLQDPSASTAGKVLAVGTDVLAVVGVGTIIKAAKTGSALLKAVVGGTKVVGGAGKAAAQGGVYVLINRETGVVMRSGRTINLVAREGQHQRDPVLKLFRFKAVYKTNIKEELRGLEQYLDDLYNPPLNKIRPISPLNPKGPGYMRAAQKFLEKTQ